MWLKTIEMCSLIVQVGRSTKSRCWAALVPEKESVPYLSPSFWRLLAILNVHWLVATSIQSLYMAFFIRVVLCVSSPF